MTTIPQGIVRRIAALARIELEAEEASRLEGEFGAVLAFVAELNAVATDGIAPFEPDGRGPEELRDDVAGRFPDAPALLLAAPASRRGYVAVPAVLDHRA